jgi:hypothetical protein
MLHTLDLLLDRRHKYKILIHLRSANKTVRLASLWVCAQYFIARRRQRFIICKRQIRDRKYFTAAFRLARAPGKNEKYKIYDSEIIILFKWQGAKFATDGRIMHSPGPFLQPNNNNAVPAI